jgi:hypothetical protein
MTAGDPTGYARVRLSELMLLLTVFAWDETPVASIDPHWADIVEPRRMRQAFERVLADAGVTADADLPRRRATP